MERVISERVEVLGAVVTWLQKTEATIVRKVVGTVWPKLSVGQSHEHPAVITSSISKPELIELVEKWVCPMCQSRLCIMPVQPGQWGDRVSLLQRGSPGDE